jgi:DnaK suppressor protein
MGLSIEQKNHYKNLLLKKLESLNQVIQHTASSIQKEEELAADAVDMAANTEERILNMQMKGREQQELLQIKSALRRVETDEYGECENCGDLISEARLSAYPLATLCIDCKATLEFKERSQATRTASTASIEL